MKKRFTARFILLLALACGWTGTQAGAQVTNLILGIQYSTNAVAVGTPLTYTMFLTNVSGVTLVGAYLTNTFTGPVTLTGTTQSQGTNTSIPGGVVFDTGFIFFGFVPELTVTVTPTNAGFFTNMLTLFDRNSGLVAGTATLVRQATNSQVQSDLAISLSVPSSPVYSNDWTTYQVSVTNLGPATVSGVLLTNRIPQGVGLISISPAAAYTGPLSAMVFNLGTLTNGASRNYTLLIQPTNSGAANLSASIGAATVTDLNLTNNAAATNLLVLNFDPAQLSVTNLTAMTNNPQTGLFNELVQLSNQGTNIVNAARVTLVGVAKLAPGTGTILYNAAGTNNGKPFVVYGNALSPGQSANLVLEYYSSTSHQPFAVQNSNYVAEAIGSVNATAAGGTNGSFNATIARLPDGSILVGFKAVIGKTYTILYGDSPGAPPLAAQPSFVAPASVGQWIDDGPPKTSSPPSNAPSRYYRVRQEN